MPEDDIEGATEGLIAAGYTPDEVTEIVAGLTEAKIALSDGEAVLPPDAVKRGPLLKLSWPSTEDDGSVADDEEPEVVDHRLRETGNGPTVSYEEALLREYFGEPDEEGVYR